MAMLAEPRQKKRYNLTPRGKPLYEDDTRYGTKMLEKWGWAKGKGLGANLHGSKDFVRVHLRNSNEGLGYEDRDDHWTQHEQDFTGLLKTLNGGNDDENNGRANESGSECDDAPRIGFGYTTEPIKPKVVKLKDKISGVSLEEKSKTSKARVHYRKFTRGKDIAQYSEKDLANIFGKKVVETEQANGVYEALTSLTWPQAEKEEDIKSTDNEVEKVVKSNFAGVQTVSTGLSVSDYFKQKMEAMKNRQKQQQNASFETVKEQAAEDVEAVVAKKKSKKRKGQVVGEEMEPEMANQESSTFVEATSAGTAACVSKNEKKKKRKEIASVDLSQEEHVEEPKKKKNKSKKRENEDSIDMDAIDEGQANLDADEEPKKAKKSKRNKDQKSEAFTNSCNKVSANQVEEISDVQKPTKAKKSKRTERVQLSEEAESPTTNNEVLTPQTLKTKRKKEKKSLDDEANLMLQNEAACLDDAVGKKKKKSKNKDNLETKTEQYLPQTEETTNDTPSTNKQINSKEEVSDDTAKSIQSMTLDELIAQYNSYNVYTISSFSAEKFRNADLERFKGANLSHLPGYSHDGKDLQLDIKYFRGDEKRITALWNCTINKYNLANPKAVFHKYRCNMVNAYRVKQKHLPRLHMKTFKRKSIFQSI